jgi:ribonuclease D
MTTLISKQESLDALYKLIPDAKTICLDTEFVRRTTYYAKLSLLQIAIEDQIYVIDTIYVNIQHLWQLIATCKGVKIIHSGRQDLETLEYLFNIIPNNIFDTQIAAGLCGYRQTSSYSELCETICKVTLDKTLQDADWLQRPLTTQMIEYAATDVMHLNMIYNHLHDIIKQNKSQYNFDTITHDLLLNPKLYNTVTQNAWKRIKHNSNNHILIERLKIIATFREEHAQKLDIPRRYFATDEQLMTICETLPTTPEALRKIPALSRFLSSQAYANKLCELCAGIKEYL